MDRGEARLVVAGKAHVRGEYRFVEFDFVAERLRVHPHQRQQHLADAVRVPDQHDRQPIRVQELLRNALDGDNRGALELGWSFPISSNLRGQLKYFKGYGHSLIDYNVDLEVFALGIVFTDLF